jgi:hypothetical protein
MLFGRASSAVDASGGRGRAAEGLDAFGSEFSPPTKRRAARVGAATDSRTAAPPWAGEVAKWLAVILLSAGAAVAGVIGYQRRVVHPVAAGTVTLETAPAGLDVTLAGKPLGKTPLTTSLAPGTYEFQVGSAPRVRTLSVNVSSGAAIVQRVEFADDGAVASGATGGLRVQTEPAHLPVLIDGTPRGFSPVSIDSLLPGDHEISVRGAAGAVRRVVTVQPRETLSLVISSSLPASPTPATVSAGWLTVASPVQLQMREEGKVIGTSESDRLMLTAGDHDIEFANDSLGFTTHKTVRVASGKTAAIRIDLPNGVLSVNALPWAEVWIDGERAGETPLGNLSRSIGTHEVLFRHPEFGERRETVVVVAGRPTRIGVDLRKK